MTRLALAAVGGFALGVLWSGIYEIETAGVPGGFFRINKFTGDVSVCAWRGEGSIRRIECYG